MELPQEVQLLISHYLEKVRSDPNHQLIRDDCHKIYKSFGPSALEQGLKNKEDYWTDWTEEPVILSFADQVLGWLAVTTARKVLPVWEQFGIPNDAHDEVFSFDPLQMLGLAENLLLRMVDTSQAKIDLCNRFHMGMAGLDTRINKNAYCAVAAAYSALQISFDGLEGLNLLSSDFERAAVVAYATIDENEIGGWSRVGYWHIEPQEGYKPVSVDSQKELEFWEWWLTEAISQAWELAGQVQLYFQKIAN